MGGGMPAAALAAIVAAPQLSWDIVWRTAGHDPKQATPKLSWHCRNIEEEEEEPLCIDSPVCPGPRGTRSVVVYWDLGSPDSIGPIVVHHKDLAERLRCDLRAKQQGELCERVGEQNLFTT